MIVSISRRAAAREESGARRPSTRTPEWFPRFSQSGRLPMSPNGV